VTLLVIWRGVLTVGRRGASLEECGAASGSGVWLTPAVSVPLPSMRTFSDPCCSARAAARPCCLPSLEQHHAKSQPQKLLADPVSDQATGNLAGVPAKSESRSVSTGPTVSACGLIRSRAVDDDPQPIGCGE
jgi:hypothetical protein